MHNRGMTQIPRTTLEGRTVRLEPLSLQHVDALSMVGCDPAIWEWSPWSIRDWQEMHGYVEEALDLEARGLALPFATVELASGRVVGSTRFGSIDFAHRRVEIGWTWLGPAWWRTAVNTEAKLLMLVHAFETWGCHRVELKTDRLNERSRSAIQRLGAKEEGTLRGHMLTVTGRWRDTVYYSILEDEWPEVRTRLLARLAARELPGAPLG